MLSSGRARDPRHDRGGDRRRDPRGGPVQAGVAPGADAGAAGASGQGSRGRGLRSKSGEAPETPSSGCPPADRALRDAAAAGADRPVPRRAQSGSARSSTPGGARSSTSRSSCRSRTWPTRARPSFPSEDGHPGRGRALRPRPLDLARDLPQAPEAGPGTHLDDHLRQQPPRLRAPRQAPERAGRRRSRAGASSHRARGARRPAEASTERSESGGAGRGRERTPCARPQDPPRGAPRIARGDRPGPPRLALPRGAHPGRGDAEVRPAPLPGRDLLAGAGDRHGRRRPRDPGRVAEVGDPRPAADRPRRPRPRRGLQRAASSPSSAATCSSARWSPGACAKARSRRR